MRVPSLNEEEAINVLLQPGGGVGFDTSDGPEEDPTPRCKEIMEKVVRMSGFGDPKNGLIYLPLVLNIMGHRLRESRLDHVQEWGREMGSFWRRVEGCKKDAVRKLVQESFNKLSLELQLLFLDLSLFYIPVYDHCIEQACALVSLMHECSPEEIERQMYSLERSCFLSMRNKYCGKFCVHDVFLEFAASIPESSMYYLSSKRNIHAKGADEGPINNQLHDVRVIVLDQLDEECTSLDFPMSWSSVKILSVRNSQSLRVLGLAGLTYLVSLEIVNCPSIERIRLVDGNHVHNHLQSLRRFRWSNEQEHIISVTEGQWWRHFLQYLHSLYYRMINEGGRPAKLRALWIRQVPVKEMVLDHASLAPSLEQLRVFECRELTRLNFECQFGDLRYLAVRNCPSLAKVIGLHRLTNLQKFGIYCSFNLAEIHGLEGLTSLQKLHIWR